MHVALRLSLVLMLVLALVAAGGCARPRYRVKERVAISGPEIVRGTDASVDVENWNGSVKVLVRPNFKRASVTAKLRRTGSDSPPRKQLRGLSTVTAESVVEGGQPVLRVRSTSTIEDPAEAEANLIICLPECSGARVRNAGGTVDLRHIDGPINVENGSGTRPGGRVEVRTGYPVHDPIHIMTSKGIVLLQISPESQGQIEMTAENGQAAIYAEGGKVASNTATYDRWSGTLNDGSNPIVLHSRNGTVWTRIVHNAAEYKPPRWPRGKITSIQPPR